MLSFQKTLLLVLCLASRFAFAADFSFTNINITVPDGFTVEVAAEAPLIGHPMMACFDERGRLFVAEAAGTNGTIDILESIKPNFIRMIEDTDGDGKFDKSTIFADQLQIPNGALWRDNSLYVAEPPGIWRYTDTNNDGVADVREHVAGKVRSNGMSSTLHGPVLGPTGRLFWCSGQGGYSLDKNQEPPKGRIAPGVFSLRPNGEEHEVFSVGGMANPVEVAFSAEGEVFGTVAILDREDGARHDALMHWVYGGIYHTSPNDPLPLKESGPRLLPLSHVGQVAPAGVMRYRSPQFGEAYRDNLFWAQFNTHKIIRTQLKRKGATFEAKDEDFLIGDNVDFHVTDVLEDADGSLLVIDTGGWFRWGCPTSQLAKPDVKGAIYRIRKTGAKPVTDPRGKELNWPKLTPAQLVALLNDARPAVEDRAIDALAQRGERAIRECLQTLQKPGATQTRRDVIWVLARMQNPNATKIIRLGIEDKDVSVRQAAIYAAGMEHDVKAALQLSKLVVSDPEASIRREAATALGRLRDATAVPKLLEALKNPVDAFLDHAIVYALIQIAQPELTEAGLEDANPRVRRGALLALSQMEKAEISRGRLLILLKSDDLELQKAAFTVARKNTNMIDDLAIVLKDWLRVTNRNEESLAFLQSATLSQATNVLTQKTIAEALAGKEITMPIRLLLLETLKRASVKPVPELWFNALEKELQEGELESRLAAVSVLQERGIRKLDKLLQKLAKDEAQNTQIRIACLNTIAPRLSPVEAEHYTFLKQQLRPETAPLLRMNAARALASLKLSTEQFIETTGLLPKIDPLVLPIVLRGFSGNSNEAVGLALVTALENTPSASNLSVDELGRIFKGFPETVHEKSKVLLKKLGADLEAQQKHLEELLPLAQGGDFSRGKAVFFGKKATCSNCHRVSGQGGVVGPNLSQIGKIRNGRDLLESVLYPSASIVQGYHPFSIETDNDQSYNGVITRQTPEAVWIRGSDLIENKVEQKHLKSMRESTVSIMPAGFGDVLTKEELRDLLAFLQELK